jgi:hypothetical protein
MDFKCLIAVLFFIYDAYILLIGLVWTYTLSNQVANKTWPTKMLNCIRGPCVVRGPVDGRFLVWWVIDNVVWTDSWLSIADAGYGLTGVGVGEEQARKVVAGEASRCGEDK